MAVSSNDRVPGKSSSKIVILVFVSSPRNLGIDVPVSIDFEFGS